MSRDHREALFDLRAALVAEADRLDALAWDFAGKSDAAPPGYDKYLFAGQARAHSRGAAALRAILAKPEHAGVP